MYETEQEKTMKTKRTIWMGIITMGLVAPLAWSLSYNPEIFMIANQGGGGMENRIVGDFFVWQGSMLMQWFGYDLEERESFPIVAGAPMGWVLNESYMVWSDNSMMNWNAFELATRRRLILPISDVDGMSLRLTGRFVIYRGMMDMTLHGMDLESGEMFVITTAEIDTWNLRAAGDYLVWATMSWPPVLTGYQLSTRQEFVISDAGMFDAMGLAMNDRFAVWTETPADPMEAGLFGFDLAKREKFRITNQMVDSYSVRIGGNYILWLLSGGQSLYGFDGVTRQLFQMASGGVDSWSLTVNEQYAVWPDMGGSNIWGFDLGARRLISTGVSSMAIPVLSKNLLFWNSENWMTDPVTYELRGFDLATGTDFPVATLSQMPFNSPVAGGDYVVWSDMDVDQMYVQILGARIWQVPNDRCTDAVVVTVGVPYSGDTTGATGTEPSECGYEDVLDTWHVFRPTKGGEYTIDVRSEAFDTTLALVDSCGGAETACNDDASSKTTDSRLTVTMVKAKPYYLRVAGVAGSFGAYELTVSAGSCPTPPKADLNGDCRVNLDDLAVFSSQWLLCGLEPRDLCNP